MLAIPAYCRQPVSPGSVYACRRNPVVEMALRYGIANGDTAGLMGIVTNDELHGDGTAGAAPIDKSFSIYAIASRRLDVQSWKRFFKGDPHGEETVELSPSSRYRARNRKRIFSSYSTRRAPERACHHPHGGGCEEDLPCVWKRCAYPFRLGTALNGKSIARATRSRRMQDGVGKKGKARFKWHFRFCNGCLRPRRRIRVYSFTRTPRRFAIAATANCLLFASRNCARRRNTAMRLRDFQEVIFTR